MKNFWLGIRRSFLLLVFGVFLAWITSRLASVTSVMVVDSVSAIEQHVSEKLKADLVNERGGAGGIILEKAGGEASVAQDSNFAKNVVEQGAVAQVNIIDKNDLPTSITPTINCIDLNTASLVELETLPGVGTKTAVAIVKARPYMKVADITKVKGIGEKKLAKLQNQACVH